MKEVTIIELSELTGVTRSQIYHLVKKDKIMILNGKVNYNNALKVVATLTIKKAKRANEKNFRQILNMLVLQNTALQKQLDLASDREKTHISELTSCRPDLPQKSTLIPPIDQSNAWSTFENDKEEKVHNPMLSENQIYSSKEPIYGNNMGVKSASEYGIQSLPTASFNNEMILSESDTSDGEPSRQKNEVIEKKEITQLDTPSLTQNNTQPSLAPKIRKKEANILPIRIPKNFYVTKRKLNTNKQSEQAPENESVVDQSKVNKNDHRD